MVSYLGDYPGARSNPIPKFIRAVNSFLDQTLKESELIILSDGCHVTQDVFQEHFSGEDRVKLVMNEKHQGWPGALRNLGIEEAKYPLITYLDADDAMLEDRLEKLVNAMKSNGFAMLLDSLYVIPHDNYAYGPRKNTVKKVSKIKWQETEFTVYETGNQGGTYQLCHRKRVKSRWPINHKNRGEDAIFIKRLLEECDEKLNTYLVPIGGYLVCHSPWLKFDV